MASLDTARVSDGAPTTTPADLRARWRRYGSNTRVKVVPFYGHVAGERQSFSNFYLQPRPTPFVVPSCCWHEAFGARHERRNLVAFSEKSIMLCKAALFQDGESFDLIASASTPQECKKLGRGVRGFDEEVWARTVCAVAVTIVFQKFSSKHLAAEREVLLRTGEQLLAEASPRDALWGIGAGTHDDTLVYPARWRGANVLGYALMEARARLRQGPEEQAADDGDQASGLLSGPKRPESPPSAPAMQRRGGGGGGTKGAAALGSVVEKLSAYGRGQPRGGSTGTGAAAAEEVARLDFGKGARKKHGRS